MLLPFLETICKTNKKSIPGLPQILSDALDSYMYNEPQYIISKYNLERFIESQTNSPDLIIGDRIS